MSETKTGLDLLRVPFPEHQISKLPKPTKQQTDEVKADYKKGIRCAICGGWHHPNVVHLDYVGHAALTDRLLDSDPTWSWEPLALGADGYPVIDKDGGMWIKLTVCGVTRLGYGDAQGKTGGDAMKERIGDALRNAAMRFGAALDLWHKGDLHVDYDDGNAASKPKAEVKAITPKSGSIDRLSEPRMKFVAESFSKIAQLLAKEDEYGAFQIYDEITDADERTALRNMLDSKQRAALKAIADQQTKPSLAGQA